ncbi:hypothetical protein EVAR_36311_1 [Eumeta japonica]|uniref:Uncharacterized protein n=1 Tax=Eumeta variegata TaxID=151549 RepID=A0A4C1VIE2_EUMVA|nr:hypothetical protein EVAR_36311_1 [Eumeta japonica]
MEAEGETRETAGVVEGHATRARDESISAPPARIIQVVRSLAYADDLQKQNRVHLTKKKVTRVPHYRHRTSGPKGIDRERSHTTNVLSPPIGGIAGSRISTPRLAIQGGVNDTPWAETGHSALTFSVKGVSSFMTGVRWISFAKALWNGTTRKQMQRIRQAESPLRDNKTLISKHPSEAIPRGAGDERAAVTLIRPGESNPAEVYFYRNSNSPVKYRMTTSLGKCQLFKAWTDDPDLNLRNRAHSPGPYSKWKRVRYGFRYISVAVGPRNPCLRETARGFTQTRDVGLEDKALRGDGVESVALAGPAADERRASLACPLFRPTYFYGLHAYTYKHSHPRIHPGCKHKAILTAENDCGDNGDFPRNIINLIMVGPVNGPLRARPRQCRPRVVIVASGRRHATRRAVLY